MAVDRTLLDRIRKCLRLSSSDNEHEAAAALGKARELMDAYGVTEADIATADFADARASGSKARRPPGWEAILSATVCRALGTMAFRDANCDRRFVGRGGAADVAAYAFDVLYRRLKAARAVYIKDRLRRCTLARKRVRADAFCEGWAASVFTKIAALYPPVEDDPSACRYIEQRFGALIPGTARGGSFRQTEADRWRGWDDGQDVDLHHGVRGAAQPEALLYG